MEALTTTVVPALPHTILLPPAAVVPTAMVLAAAPGVALAELPAVALAARTVSKAVVCMSQRENAWL